MTQASQTRAHARADTGLATILFAALIGAGLLFAAGFADAELLHAAGHDGRHGVSFPCH